MEGDYTHNPVNEYNGDAAPVDWGALLLTHGRDVDHIRTRAIAVPSILGNGGLAAEPCRRGSIPHYSMRA